MSIKLPKDPLDSGKWVHLRLKKLEDGTYRFERSDLDRGHERARAWSGPPPMTGYGERFLGICTEIVIDFKLTEVNVLYEWKDIDEKPGRADFTIWGKHGDIDIEIKSCPHYGEYIILRKDRADFDYVVGVQWLAPVAVGTRVDVIGYLPVSEALGYPVLEDTEHHALREGLGSGRPIPLSGLRPITELMDILRAP